jgi:hypothetical protein
VVESGNELRQPAVPDTPVTEAAEQVTWTAEIGTVGQPEKVLEPDCTLSVQLFRCVPRRIVHVKTAEDDPETAPESGLEELKLIVPGAAESSCTVPGAKPIRIQSEGPTRGFEPRARPTPQVNTAAIMRMPARTGLWFRWR